MFDDIVELACADDDHLDELDREQIGEMYVQALDMVEYGGTAKAKLTKHIAERFDEPLTLSNGMVLQPDVATKWSAFRKPALADQVVQHEARWLVDPETGDRVRALPIDVVGQYFEPATGRKRTWFDAPWAGFDYADFATVERDVPTVNVIKPTDNFRRPR